MSEVYIPEYGFQSFNEFFHHRLLPGSRIIEHPNDMLMITSPNDGFYQLGQAIPEAFNVKGIVYDIKLVLGNHPLSSRFYGGTLIQMTLFPYNYHRYHSPIDGKINR
eukprot:UN26049